MKYLRNHWNGRLSPLKAYWINSVLITFLLQQKLPWEALNGLILESLGYYEGTVFFALPTVWFLILISQNIWAMIGAYRTPISSIIWRVLGRIYCGILVLWLFRNVLVFHHYPQSLLGL